MRQIKVGPDICFGAAALLAPAPARADSGCSRKAVGVSSFATFAGPTDGLDELIVMLAPGCGFSSPPFWELALKNPSG